MWGWLGIEACFVAGECSRHCPCMHGCRALQACSASEAGIDCCFCPIALPPCSFLRVCLPCTQVHPSRQAVRPQQTALLMVLTVRTINLLYNKLSCVTAIQDNTLLS